MLKIYNTLTRKLDTFKPVNNEKVTMYTCGPTVYDYAHIGNFRSNVFFDVLKRALKFLGYDVLHVMNLTDVEDKIIRKSKEKNLSINEYTQPYIEAFFEDLATLRIIPADVFPKATEHIDEMIDLIEMLNKKGYTYEKGGSVYFNIGRFDSYGDFAGIDRNELKDGARVDSDEYGKENAQDFVLWKAVKEEGEPSWPTPFGEGRPGWHLECSAMAMKYLGETIDIHCGGEDLVFPHHQNEIAQSEAATGKPFVNYWMHCAHLQMGEQKMSKSLGNFYTLRDLVDKGVNPVHLRYLLLSTNYRSPLLFSFDLIDQAGAAVDRIRDFARRLEREKPEGGDAQLTKDAIAAASTGFRKMIEDDLNMSGALGEMFTFIKSVNTMLDDKKFTADGIEEAKNLLLSWDTLLDVLKDVQAENADSAEIEKLIEDRKQARAEKDWAKADEIRDKLVEMGIILEDTPQGTIWKKK